MLEKARQLHQWLLKLEIAVLLLLSLSLILIAVIQIILRNFFDAGLLWAESYIRLVVLWLALLGGMVAARNNEHLAIDALMHKLGAKAQSFIRRFTALFSAVVCAVFTYYSVGFVYSEYKDGGAEFEGIPNWLCESIIPFAFFIIACRYLLIAVLQSSEQKS